jgi:hypothetical protein
MNDRIRLLAAAGRLDKAVAAARISPQTEQQILSWLSDRLRTLGGHAAAHA